MFGLGGFELAIIAGIVVLLFGNRLPGAARSLGQSFSAFKKGIKEGSEDDDPVRTASDGKIDPPA
ncbi:MAG: twin-arginine translocase TatA/TatE family subunit [Planctomycetaceae bacterium]